MSKLNTSNLYAELDKQKKKIAELEDERMRHSSFMSSLTTRFFELGKVILLVAAVGGIFIWKHDGNIIQNAKDYFENFGNPAYENRGKMKYQKDVIMESKEAQTLVPVIEMQGRLKRDGVDYVIFKYKNKVYTRTIGEMFPEDNSYRISGISKDELEVQDLDGNFFYYSLVGVKQ